MKFKTRKREIQDFVDEICIDGCWFEINDLIETLEEVKRDSVAITNRNMAKALIKRKVLSHAGSRRSGTGAWVGSNYDKFLARMKEYKKKEYKRVEEKDICEQEGSIYAYMCLIDWKYEAPFNIDGNRICYSIESLKRVRPCVEDCGIVEVKVSFVKVVQEGKDRE